MKIVVLFVWAFHNLAIFPHPFADAHKCHERFMELKAEFVEVYGDDEDKPPILGKCVDVQAPEFGEIS